jgi:hypothetical protein
MVHHRRWSSQRTIAPSQTEVMTASVVLKASAINGRETRRLAQAAVEVPDRA